MTAKITTDVEDITPHKAAEYLRHNTANRPLSRVKVTKWVEQMRKGEWKFTHQGIAFSHEGVLLDGQHRLQAIIEYGKPVRCLVTRGLPPDAFDVIDVGSRTSRTSRCTPRRRERC